VAFIGGCFALADKVLRATNRPWLGSYSVPYGEPENHQG
jgi:hypothetical protein